MADLQVCLNPQVSEHIDFPKAQNLHFLQYLYLTNKQRLFNMHIPKQF